MNSEKLAQCNEHFKKHPEAKDWVSKDSSVLVLRYTDSLSPREKRIYVKRSDKLGSGGYGSVYKGRCIDVEGVVAVKVFNKKQLDVEKIEAEAKHISIVYKSAAKAIISKKKAYLVMEYIDGQVLALKTKLNDEVAQLNFEGRVEIAFFLSQRLLEIHYGKTPLLHLDIKAENILVNVKKRLVRFVDFGFAKIAPEQSKDLLPLKYSRGTASYCAPEALLEFQASERSDVFSFALVLLILFSCKNPKKHRDGKWKEIYDNLNKEGLLEAEEKKSLEKRLYVKEAVTQDYCYEGFCHELDVPTLGINTKAALLGFIMQMGKLKHDERPGTAMLAEFMRILNNACKLNRYNSTSIVTEKRTLFSDTNKATLLKFEQQGARVLAQERKVI